MRENTDQKTPTTDTFHTVYLIKPKIGIKYIILGKAFWWFDYLNERVIEGI